MSREVLTGWGRTISSVADVVVPETESEIETHLATAAHVAIRGLGRSYGDAAQLGGGVVISNRALSGLTNIHHNSHEISVGAGVTFDELLSASIPQGFFVPVTPGTRHVTIGGALAADVHGKNHHLDGSIARHIVSYRLVTPSGVKVLSEHSTPELFWSTMGAMGLTGVISEVTMRMLPIETDQMVVDTDKFDDLDSLMNAMTEGDGRYRYSVAWVDCMSRGRSHGRGILTRGDHARASDVESVTLGAPKASRISIPNAVPMGLVNSLSVTAFNEMWFRKSPRHRDHELHSIPSFFHPLDGVEGWNHLYGRRGFVQYQFVVPDESADTIVRAIKFLAESRVPSLIGVLKRFGDPTDSPLSFPMRGWTLALDFPIGPTELPDVLRALDHLVVDAGGRVYLAKDARVDADMIPRMYPRLDEFRRLKASIDPRGVLTSDLARRLDITKD